MQQKRSGALHVWQRPGSRLDVLNGISIKCAASLSGSIQTAAWQDGSQGCGMIKSEVLGLVNDLIEAGELSWQA